MNIIEQMVVVNFEQGLHMRPVSDLVELARTFQSKITICAGGKTVDAKGIIGILNLGVKKNDEIKLAAEGTDADAAIGKLVEFLQSEE
jgi:phosphocarrier protein HPr